MKHKMFLPMKLKKILFFEKLFFDKFFKASKLKGVFFSSKIKAHPRKEY